ncbi:hypothetical protein RHMOL_Rhmol13G0191200 [Rhododendron molle]|uniref:Uncharacterized protein n=1 Tax=Rhododendron molle TaxID=49168 RepID=A0ACC0L886_RHOML|nr:hypothetical protein RHMOL_Rhmol13G0191200 [Rhododendron molle]
MVSLEDSHSTSSRFPATRPFYSPSSSPSPKTYRSMGRSMRTIRSNLYHTNHTRSFPGDQLSENLTDSAVDFRLDQLAAAQPSHHSPYSDNHNNNDDYFLDLSQTFSDYSACSSDISGELQRLATIPNPENESDLYPEQPESEPEPEPCLGFLQRESFSTEIIESISPEDLQPTVKICIDGLRSSSTAVKRSAAAKLRLLAKNRSDNRVLIAESGAVPALIPLLRCADPWAQEHAVTALLNLSLHEANRGLITNAGAIKSLIYVLKTGTETSKQNAACALLSLSLLEENKVTIGACGAIPPLVGLLIHGSCRGKKDALTTLYKLCSVRVNKERAVRAGAVGPLVGMVVAGEEGGNNGVGEKALVVLSSLAGVEEGKAAIVEEGGIAALVEAVEDGSSKGKEFAVLTLLMLCGESVRNRGLLVREGGIPPLVALSQTGTAKAKHKAETLLRYLREPRQEASTSSP